MLQKKNLIIILTTFWLLFSCDAKKAVTSLNEQTELKEFWSSVEFIETQEDDRWKRVADEVAAIGSTSTSDSACYRAIEATFRSGLQSEWSAKLITSNSFSKRSFTSALLTEEYSNLGDFDDCLAVSVANVITAHKEPSILNFHGKYCLVNVSTPQLGYYKPSVEDEVLANFSISSAFEKHARSWLTVRNRFPFVHGVCVPSICSTSQVERLIGKYFEKYTKGMRISVDYCQEDGQSFERKPGFLIALKIVIAAIFVVLLATIFNLPVCASSPLLQQSLAPIRPCLAYFDLVKNFKSLCQAKHQDKNATYDLRFIHGLKAFMIFVMTVGHSFSYLNVIMFYKVSPFRKFPSNVIDFLNEPLLSGFWEKVVTMVSIFFIVSGFLSTYIAFLKIKRPPSLVAYIFLRWFYLLPSVVGTLCFTILFQHFGTGPLFHPALTDPYVAPCHYNWWAHVLFINNFWPADQMCGINLWFIAVSFQLHVVMYLVVVFYFWKKVYAFVVAALLASVSATLLVLGYFDIAGLPSIKSVIRFNFPFPTQSLATVYMSPLLHFMPYFFGVIIALFCLNNKFSKIPNMQNFFCTLLWGVFILVALALHIPGPEASNEQRNFLVNCCSFAVFVLIITLNTGWFFMMILSKSTTFVKRTLSLKMWLPLSRLSFGIYLLNPLLIWYHVHLNRVTPTLSIMSSINFSFTIYLQSIVLALLLFLIFEAPFGAFINDIARRSISRTSSDENNNTRKQQFEGDIEKNSNVAWNKIERAC